MASSISGHNHSTDNYDKWYSKKHNFRSILIENNLQMNESNNYTIYGEKRVQVKELLLSELSFEQVKQLAENVISEHEALVEVACNNRANAREHECEEAFKEVLKSSMEACNNADNDEIDFLFCLEDYSSEEITEADDDKINKHYNEYFQVSTSSNVADLIYFHFNLDDLLEYQNGEL